MGLRDQNNGKKIGISGPRIYHVTTLYFRGFRNLEKVEIQLNIMYIQYKNKNSFNKSRNSPNQQRKVLVTNSVT